MTAPLCRVFTRDELLALVRRCQLSASTTGLRGAGLLEVRDALMFAVEAVYGQHTDDGHLRRDGVCSACGKPVARHFSTDNRFQPCDTL